MSCLLSSRWRGDRCQSGRLCRLNPTTYKKPPSQTGTKACSVVPPKLRTVCASLIPLTQGYAAAFARCSKMAAKGAATRVFQQLALSLWVPVALYSSFQRIFLLYYKLFYIRCQPIFAVLQCNNIDFLKLYRNKFLGAGALRSDRNF